MTLQVIVGGQFGSEGKGAIAAHLAADFHDLFAVRVAGPNAGHTVIGRCPSTCPERNTEDGIGAHHADQHPWRLRQVPVAAVTNRHAILGIAPGSEIDPDVLVTEIRELDDAGYFVSHRLWVDEHATIIAQEHKEAEQMSGLGELAGSTLKGIGAARANRIMRTAETVGDWREWPCQIGDLALHVRQRLIDGNDVQIEGTQGYGLGLHTDYYPQCTSSDCTALDFMAMAGATPWLVRPEDLQIWVVYRTYPIRVAGNSGPLKDETTWGAVGQPEEYTTVTRKVRRVGSWDPVLARRALAANGHQPGRSNVFAALTMADYVLPDLAGVRSLQELPGEPALHDQFDQVIATYSKDIGTLVRLVGTGPQSVIDLRKPGGYPLDGIGGRHHKERMIIP